MRQTGAMWIVGLVAVILVGAVAAFSVARWGVHREGEHVDETEGGHEQDEYPGQEYEHAQPEEGEAHPQASLSGTLQDGTRVVQVKARRFEFEPSTIVVREGENVRLLITSEDVPHGFGLKDYGIDKRLRPGRPQEIAFTAGKPGNHPFRCSVRCGPGHRDMRGELLVLEASD